MVSEILNLDLQALIGIRADALVIALAILVIVLIIVMISNGVKMSKLRKRYERFMEGKDAQTLESLLSNKLKYIDKMIDSEEENRNKIDQMMGNYELTYQKIGLVKYDAFYEQAGKLSFTLCLLNRRDDGFILNAMHNKEGCFTYMKEVINGNPITLLSEEEREALDMAINYRPNYKKEN